MRSNEESMNLMTQTRSQWGQTRSQWRLKRGVNEPYGDSNEESMSLMTQTRSQSEESMSFMRTQTRSQWALIIMAQAEVKEDQTRSQWALCQLWLKRGVNQSHWGLKRESKKTKRGVNEDSSEESMRIQTSSPKILVFSTVFHFFKKNIFLKKVPKKLVQKRVPESARCKS